MIRRRPRSNQTYTIFPVKTLVRFATAMRASRLKRRTARTVEIFIRGDRIAVHMRGSGNGRHTTLPEHMPSSHRRFADWTLAKILTESGRVGPCAQLLCEKILEEDRKSTRLNSSH